MMQISILVMIRLVLVSGDILNETMPWKRSIWSVASRFIMLVDDQSRLQLIWCLGSQRCVGAHVSTQVCMPVGMFEDARD